MTDVMYNAKSSMNQQVMGKTIGEVRTFLSEILNGTSNYKSISNLTEQMTYDYANRFIIELIQNGHDAIKASGEMGKIKIVLDESVENIPVLYFANTGNAFSESNFESISKIGQSDKDPLNYIGNKGIGFKSVLQVCKTPQIYSGVWNEKVGYSGYCFEFNPRKLGALFNLIFEMIDKLEVPHLGTDFGINNELVDWDTIKIESFKQILLDKSNKLGVTLEEYLLGEIKYLSPYILPFSLKSEDKVLSEFAQEDYVTVIKLELTEDHALANAKKALSEINLQFGIFLDSIQEITIKHLNAREENLSCQINKRTSLINHWVKEIELVNTTKQEKKNYFVFSKKMGGEHDVAIKQYMLEAVKELPEKWRNIDSALLEIAIPIQSQHEDGYFYIFLPTHEVTELSFHINAPFYGQMNRKKIDSSLMMNNLLLKEIAFLMYDAVHYLVENRPAHCENMIIDLLSFRNNDNQLTSIIFDSFLKVLSTHNIHFKEWRVFPYRNQLGELNFGAMNKVYQFPENWEYNIFTKNALIHDLNIKILSGVSVDRLASIEALTNFIGISIKPQESQYAKWAEQMAASLLLRSNESSMWQLFYEECLELIPDPDCLLKKKVLFGEDGELHRGGMETSIVYFRPTQTSDSEVKIETSSNSMNIPLYLRGNVAFLHSNINLYESVQGRKGRNLNTLAKYFKNSFPQLVEDYSLESILDHIILPNMPDKVILYDDPKSKELFEILKWAISLYQGSRQRPDSLQSKFGRICVPCVGGWYPAKEAYFTGSWDGLNQKIKYGYILDSYFSDTEFYQEGINKQLLVSEKINQYLGIEIVAEFFNFCGVADYIRLIPIPKEKITIDGNNYKYQVKDQLQGHLSMEQMEIYKETIEKTNCRYSGHFTYELQDIHTIEGFNKYPLLSKEGKINFAKLVSVSIPHWDQWMTSRIRKVGGDNFIDYIPSLVLETLIRYRWLPTGKDENIIFEQPKDALYVLPLELRSRSFSYSFLPYVSLSVTQLMEEANSRELFNRLGLLSYHFKSAKEGLTLLQMLAERLESGTVQFEHYNYFKFHYRTFWNQVIDILGEDEVVENLPTIFVVTKQKNLHTMNVESGSMYLPDNKKMFMQLQDNPLINMLLLETGKKYVQFFQKYYGDSFICISSLNQIIMIDGEIWTEEKGNGLNTLLTADERDWLLPYVVAVATYREDMELQLGGKRFYEIAALLRKAKLTFCEKIEVILENTFGHIMDKTTQNFAVCKDTNVFFITHQESTDLGELASCFREYLEYSTLEVPLRLTFSKLSFDFNNGEKPLRQSILTSLEQIKIVQDNYETVERLINANVQWILERIYPILFLNKDLTEIDDTNLLFNDEDDLKRWLDPLLSGNMDADTLLLFAKEVKNDIEMGYKLFKKYGISLKEWNYALNKIGSKYQIENVDIFTAFGEQSQTVKVSIFAFLRYLVIQGEMSIEQYTKSKIDYTELRAPSQWTKIYWEIDQVSFITEVINYIRSLEVSDEIELLFTEVKSIKQLQKILNDKEIDISLTEYDISKRNRFLLKEVFINVQKLMITYYTEKEMDIPPFWIESEQSAIEQLLKVKQVEALEMLEISLWNNHNAFHFFMECSIVSDSMKELFHDEKFSSYESLVDMLEIRGQLIVENTHEIIEKQKERKRREKRSVSILGKEFDTDESNLFNLGSYFDDFEIKDSHIKGSISSPVQLMKMEKGRKTQIIEQKKGRTFGVRKLSRSVEMTVGIAGEILIYQLLKREYEGKITPENWKSYNSKYEFQDKDGDDSLGFDFELNDNHITYLIEVKTTIGNSFKFEMGSSETRIAMGVAKRRTTKYMIAFVVNVFESPEVYWLPNPFSNEGSSFYNITDVGARITFKL